MNSASALIRGNLRRFLQGLLRAARSGVSAARRTVRSVISFADKTAHSARRRRALGRLRRLDGSGGVLVVCYGNVCRSPYAEAVLRRRLALHGLSRLRIESGGFIGPDRSVPGEALQAARRRGVDLSDHRSRLVTSESVQAASVVFVMNRAQARQIREMLPAASETVIHVLGDFDPWPDMNREIVDPWGRPPDIFDAVYDRIERCVEAWSAAQFAAGGDRSLSDVAAPPG